MIMKAGRDVSVLTGLCDSVSDVCAGLTYCGKLLSL